MPSSEGRSARWGRRWPCSRWSQVGTQGQLGRRAVALAGLWCEEGTVIGHRPDGGSFFTDATACDLCVFLSPGERRAVACAEGVA